MASTPCGGQPKLPRIAPAKPALEPHDRGGDVRASAPSGGVRASARGGHETRGTAPGRVVARDLSAHGELEVSTLCSVPAVVRSSRAHLRWIRRGGGGG